VCLGINAAPWIRPVLLHIHPTPTDEAVGALLLVLYSLPAWNEDELLLAG